MYASAYVLYMHIMKYWSQIHYASLGLMFTNISIMSLPIYSHSGLYSSTNWTMNESNGSKELSFIINYMVSSIDSFQQMSCFCCSTVLYVVFTTSAQSLPAGASAIHDIIPV